MAPAERRVRLALVAIVVADGLAVRGRAREAVIFEVLAARLPAQPVDLTGGRAGDAPHCAAAGLDLRASRGLAAAAGDDLHDTGDRVRSVERALRTADDFHSVDVFERYLGKIQAATERVGADAVDEYEREIGFTAAREQRGDRAGA